MSLRIIQLLYIPPHVISPGMVRTGSSFGKEGH